jgi:hypothetical protein
MGRQIYARMLYCTIFYCLLIYAYESPHLKSYDSMIFRNQQRPTSWSQSVRNINGLFKLSRETANRNTHWGWTSVTSEANRLIQFTRRCNWHSAEGWCATTSWQPDLVSQKAEMCSQQSLKSFEISPKAEHALSYFWISPRCIADTLSRFPLAKYCWKSQDIWKLIFWFPTQIRELPRFEPRLLKPELCSPLSMSCHVLLFFIANKRVSICSSCVILFERSVRRYFTHSHWFDSVPNVSF